jgi:hypothetical protein
LFRKRVRAVQVCNWDLVLLRFQICIVFLYVAYAKMNVEWLIYGAPLYLNFVQHFTAAGHPFQEKWMAIVLSWAGMLSDLGIGLCLTINRWPRVSFIWLCLFDGLNVFFFGLGIKTFPYLMVCSYVLFIPGGRVRALFAQMRRISALISKA